MSLDTCMSGLTCRALLERQKLLRAERLVVDLARCLDQILQVRAGEKVAEVDKFAVALVLDVDGAPAVLATSDRLAVDCDGRFTADYCKWNDGLSHTLVYAPELAA